MRNIFEFNVRRDEKQLFVSRTYESSLSALWKAWTTAELLDQWWGPRPWRAETKLMDFREGGAWHYAMVGPDGEKHRSIAKYITIENEKYILAKDGFCDQDGLMNPSYPQNLWETRFIDTAEKCRVEITLTFDSPTDLDTTLEMGFEEGFTMGLNQLENLLPTLNK